MYTYFINTIRDVHFILNLVPDRTLHIKFKYYQQFSLSIQLYHVNFISLQENRLKISDTNEEKCKKKTNSTRERLVRVEIPECKLKKRNSKPTSTPTQLRYVIPHFLLPFLFLFHNPQSLSTMSCSSTSRYSDPSRGETRSYSKVTGFACETIRDVAPNEAGHRLAFRKRRNEARTAWERSLLSKDHFQFPFASVTTSASSQSRQVSVGFEQETKTSGGSSTDKSVRFRKAWGLT